MIQSKSIYILKTFSKEELRQFGYFIRSPFHNNNKKLIKLFDALKKYHPEYEIENEKIYSKVYPDKTYNHDNLRKLMSEKFLILEKFLLHLKIKKENFNTDKYLLEEYVQRKLNELFLFKVKKITEKQEEINYYTYGFFYDKYRLEDLIVSFYHGNNMCNKIPIDSLIKRSEYSLCCFLENILADIVDINELRGISDKFKEAIISESLLKNLDLKIFLKNLTYNKIKNDFIIFQINLILMLIYPENEIYFKKAKQLMFSNYNNSIKENSKGFLQYYIVLQNYCIKMVQKGKIKFELELFEILKHRLKLLLENFDENKNKFQSIIYLNLVKQGLRLNELEWVEEFMEDHAQYIEEKDKENTYNYAKALLEFAKQNYEVSLSYASKLSIRTSYYWKMDINILILKCYFELSLYDAAFSLIDSSKHYLLKTDEMDYDLKENCRRILSIIHKLLKFKINPNDNVKSDLLNLRSEIVNNIRTYFSQKWYLQKVEELEKKSISIKVLPRRLNKKSQSKKLLKIA